MDSHKHDLHDLVAQASTKIAAEYERIRKRSKEDPGTAGDQGEGNWASLLRDWLPASYHVVTKGRLVAHDGKASPQLDVIVLKPSYPAGLRDIKMYVPSGVAAAFECKTTLRSKHLSEVAENAAKVKAIYPARKGSPYRELRTPFIYGLLAHSHEWKRVGSNPVENIHNGLVAADLQHVTHPRLGIDIVCVADLASWSSMACPFYDLAWRDGDQKGHVAVTSLLAATADSLQQHPHFNPIGTMIANLWHKLAWEDPDCRPIADYLHLARVGGNASGPMREWPLPFSEEVMAGIPTRLSSGAFYDEWGFGLS